MVNVPLLRKVLEHITEHPEEHSQHVWAARSDCGTTMCVAGHAVSMTGHDMMYSSLGAYGEAVGCTDKDGVAYSIQAAAAKELDLSPSQASGLFHGANTLGALWRIANHITDEIEVPERFL